MLTSILFSAICSPLNETNVDMHGHAVELASSLLKVFQSYCMDSRLEQIVEHLYQVVGCDLTYDTYIFPFLSRVLFIGKSSQSDRLPTFISLLGHFLPMLEQIVFGRSEYVDAGIPDANKEFGSFGNGADMKAPEITSIVNVDSNQSERKAFALDALIYIYLFYSEQEMLDEMKKEAMQSELVKLCQHYNSTIRHHAVRDFIIVILLYYIIFSTKLS